MVPAMNKNPNYGSFYDRDPNDGTVMNKDPNYDSCFYRDLNHSFRHAIHEYLGINRDMDPDPQH